MTEQLKKFVLAQKKHKVETVETYYNNSKTKKNMEANKKRLRLKVDKNNTITIKKVKDSWSREEVIEFGNKVKEYCKDGWKEET